MPSMRACVALIAVILVIESLLVSATPEARKEPKRFKRSLHRTKRAAHDIRNCETSPTYLPPTVIRTEERLKLLRDRMRERRWDLDAYIISNTDPHLSEVPPLRDRRQEFMSGFRGAYGTAIVTLDKAMIWTDARYWIQAEQQLDCNWELMKEGTIDEERDPNDPELPDILIPSPVEWLLEYMPVEAKIGFDPRLMSIDEYFHYNLTFEHYEFKRLTMVWIQEFEYNNEPDEVFTNIIDYLWEREGSRPAYAREPLVTVDADTYTGYTWEEKIFGYKDERSLRWIMKEKNAEALIITKLDEVAWLFNLRSADIPNNPFFLAYSIITNNEIRLYLYDRQWKVNREVEDHLGIGQDSACPEYDSRNRPLCLQLRNYNDFLDDVNRLLIQTSGRIWVTNSSSIAVFNASTPKTSSALREKRFVEQSPILRMKAVKTKEEIDGMKNAHIRDSVNFVRIASYIEETVEYQREQNKRIEPDDPDYRIYISELDVIKRLEEFRKQELSYVMPSFQTVSAFGHHSAMVTYNVTEQSDIRIDETKLYLLETGAHYLDGTTDIARTFWFEYKKTPPQHLRDQYTRVLMGLIDLSDTVFRTNIYGRELDAIARRALWKNGLDYLHATGHGVGHYLNVNEGPIGFGLGYEVSEIPLERNMVLTNEPGYYSEKNEYGIRLENVMVIVQANTNYTFGDYDWNTFDTISLVPFEKNLIDHTMLSIDQIKWLNTYNKKVRKVIGPYLGSSTTTARKWLDRRTEKITYKYSVSGAETTVSTSTQTGTQTCFTDSASRALYPFYLIGAEYLVILIIVRF
ncbi:xaa-Pro aminopeptidase 2-like isoform X2 [Amphiura filiformis]|uniref:xaa-Pro aminopeptidase 2-like isoform X2 n=1 Tax=Amphiura filiformis TaxID=82378 RepID=UPI003B21EA75